MGTPVDSRHMDLGKCFDPPRPLPLHYHDLPPAEPTFVAMSHTHIVAASSSALFVWHYRPVSSISRRPSELTFLTGSTGMDVQDYLLHVDSPRPLSGLDFKRAAVVREGGGAMSGRGDIDIMMIIAADL